MRTDAPDSFGRVRFLSERQGEVSTLDGIIREDEQLEDLQLKGLRILQKKRGFRFGMDAVLLADFARIRPKDSVADFGTGTGILPLLLLARDKGQRFHTLEIQPEMADMAARTMVLNDLCDRVSVHTADVCGAEALLGAGAVDAVISNPPYGTPGNTLHSPFSNQDVARNQREDGLLGWWKAAHRILRGKGTLSVIYPAPRMLELMESMEAARLTPKRFRLVYPRADAPANLVLVEAVKDAKPMLHPMPPLIVYCTDGSWTEELQEIYHLRGEEGSA